jgi:hypothetical protein
MGQILRYTARQLVSNHLTTDTAEQNKVKLVGREDILSLGAIARELMNGQ